MCDCERERSSHKLSKRTVSLWSVLDVYLVLFATMFLVFFGRDTYFRECLKPVLGHQCKTVCECIITLILLYCFLLHLICKTVCECIITLILLYCFLLHLERDVAPW